MMRILLPSYGSAPSLYNRLKIYDGMDSTVCEQEYDPICEPSY